MPRRPDHPCAHSGCPALTQERYCTEHTKLYSRHYEQYQRDPDTWKRYGPQWRVIRKAYISQHPLCEMCQQNGRLTPATEIHHKIPVRAGGGHGWENLLAVCKACHSSITIQTSMKT